ncbi:DUF882 domain-containing protein [Belnapia rosea]|uniref:DUF882 domain-containing protein n=1 Tax=Belnapia rosea TaxID=938405 RepID=UPI00088A9D6C|nr:DUF882 domain-containing protein [Belnapia rosea]SDB56054.1 Uncharacterized conserved protein YcbK, DUF882 family [Belnapia rosea]
MQGCPCCDGFGRRNLLRGALGLGLACTGIAPAPAQILGGGPRSLAIQRIQTGESFEGAYWRDGRYDREALQQLDWVFRDPSLEEVTPMDPRLFDLLAAVARQMDATEGYQVVSGYRAPETNAARARESRRVSRASLHMSGMAADVRLVGRESMGMARLAAEMQMGGVGLYRRDGFVHLDCGPSRRW